MIAAQTPPGSTLEAELEVAEMVGRLMHFWGFKRPMGRMWTILYLNPQPMSAADLAASLKMSAGGVSMALAELEKWGCVVRTWIPGDRRDYFVAEDDIWKMVKRVLGERELALVRDFAETLTAAKRSVETAEDGTPAADLSYKRQRLERLASWTTTGEALLSALVAGNSIDPTALYRQE